MAVFSSTESPLAAATDPGMGPMVARNEDIGLPEDETPDPADDERGKGYGRPRGMSVREFLVGQIDQVNLAENYSPQVLDTLGGLVVREYQIDETSRADWKDKAEKAMKFATQEAEQKNFPWAGASNVIYPLITTAALQYNARAYPAIIQSRNVVKGTIWGSDKGQAATIDGKPDGQPKLGPNNQPIWLVQPGEKRRRADAIGEHMSWQLLEEMPEWEPQTDQMLFQIPIVGGAVRKTFRDFLLRRNRSLLVKLLDLVWNYDAPSFEAAPRHTELIELYPHEIEAYERAGIFLVMEYGPGDGGKDGKGDQGDQDAPHLYLEQHRRYDLDEDGYPEPYIVTVHKRSTKVVRIVARYDADGITTSRGPKVDEQEITGGGQGEANYETESDEIIRIAPVDLYTLIPFLPNPEGGSYPFGFGHLARPLNEAINTSLNQMFDAGTLQNAGGGFISDQLSMQSGPVAFQVGKYVRVGSKGMDIRQAVFPIPFQGPSNVLFQLLGLLMSSGKEITAVQDVLTGDVAKANTPPTTILALIEQGMKIYSAIHKRVYRAFKSEFAKLYRLNSLYLKDTQRFRVGDEWREVTPEDYKFGGGVEPVADPTMLTDMQKLGRAQVLMTLKDDPLFSKKQIYTRFLQATNTDRIDDLWAPPDQTAPHMAAVMLAEKQADIQRTNAAELKDRTQAFLNLALARAQANGPEVQWIEAQLRATELHIEAVNTQVKAAAVASRHHVDMTRIINDANNDATSDPTSSQPGGAAVPGNAGPGISPLAPQPNLGSFPEISGGGAGQLPSSGPTDLGSG